MAAVTGRPSLSRACALALLALFSPHQALGFLPGGRGLSRALSLFPSSSSSLAPLSPLTAAAPAPASGRRWVLLPPPSATDHRRGNPSSPRAAAASRLWGATAEAADGAASADGAAAEAAAAEEGTATASASAVTATTATAAPAGETFEFQAEVTRPAPSPRLGATPPLCVDLPPWLPFCALSNATRARTC